MLHTEPSFCIYNVEDGCEGEGRNQQQREALDRSVIIGEITEGNDFSFGGKKGMGLIDEAEGGFGGLNGIQTLSVEGEVELVSPPIHLFDPAAASPDLDAYKRMIDEFPSNPRVLRNYALLLQSKGDLDGAEEYYFRATQADPEDGEVLLKYAELIWELHHDRRSAITYFEQAAQVAPDDSHILAAYARFLWEEEIDEGESEQDHIQVGELCREKVLENLASKECVDLSLRQAVRLGLDRPETTAPDSCKNDNDDEYCCKSKVEERPLFLRNYAKLLQSKGNLEGAEEYYRRAMLADPGDGQIVSEYAKLVWELHHDRDKCLHYFEQAIQATPGDSNVLAAYASFLWETGEES